MSIKKVTFIGLGVMGYPMAGHLKKKNLEVLFLIELNLNQMIGLMNIKGLQRLLQEKQVRTQK